jgi:hypothetical protein
MLKVGEAIFDNVDTDGTATADKFNAIYTISLEDILDSGPEKGWKFASQIFNCISRDSSSITVFADYSGTVTGTVLVTDTGHPYVSGDVITISDGSVGSYDGDQVVTVVDANSYHFTATFVSTETATANWTSQEFIYRYKRPTSIRVTRTSVGGIELTDWNRKGDYILTNLEGTEVDMDYIAAVAGLSVSNFPPHFINAFRMKLASDLAYDLVQNTALGERLLLEYLDVWLPNAIGMDNREIYVQESSNSWIAAGHTRQTIE